MSGHIAADMYADLDLVSIVRDGKDEAGMQRRPRSSKGAAMSVVSGGPIWAFSFPFVSNRHLMGVYERPVATFRSAITESASTFPCPPPLMSPSKLRLK